MTLKLSSAPATEPISLAEAKLHLRLDSGSMADNITSVQSIAPGSHAIAAAYSLLGTSVDVLGYSTLVLFESGTNGAGGTVDVKLQESDNGTSWTDVTSGAFTQVTTANDNATYEKAYTGTKQYLRVVSTVAGNACEFGVSIVKQAPTSAEDDWLTSTIKAARRYCEKVQHRSYITQTWELWLDSFPGKDYIELPLPPIQEPAVTAGAFVTGTVYRILSVGTTDFTLIGASANTVGVVFTATAAGSGTGTATASGIVKYYGTDNTEYFMDGADLFLDIKSEPGRLGLAYGESWPSTSLRPFNGVCVTFVTGYGNAASVPEDAVKAMKLLIGHWYEHRDGVLTGTISKEIEFAVTALLTTDRLWSF